MEDVFDIVIVGAGTGGTVAAITAAKSGLDVCLIDNKPKEKIGNKVCGDIIWKDYFDILHKRIGISHPKNQELNQIVDGLKIVAPDNKTSVQIEQEHYMINRHLFGQRLVNKATDSGATLLDGLVVKEPTIKDNFVVGVVAKDKSTNEQRNIYGKVVIDASGALPILRDKVVLDGSFLERNVSKDDMAIAYREVRLLKEDMPESNFARICLSNKYVPGGYTWYFPDGHHRVNVGIGVGRSIKDQKLKTRFGNVVFVDPIFSNSWVLHSGAGILPTRKPLCSLVANGFMCAGDAGCQINPISGAGIEYSMTGGYLAATTAIDAIIDNDVSQENLWGYNKLCMDSFGAAQTSMDIFRILFQSSTDDEITFGLKYLVNEKAISAINGGKPIDTTRKEKAKILFKSRGKLEFLSKFNSVAENMQKAKELCENYPQPNEFRDWERKLNAIYSDTHNIVKR